MTEASHTTKYDADLKKVANLYWLPWIGKDYPEAQKKLLIVGESYLPWGPYNPPYIMDGTSKRFGRDLMNGVKGSDGCLFDGLFERHKKNPNLKVITPRGEANDFHYALSLLLFKKTEKDLIDNEQLKTAWDKVATTNFLQNSASHKSKAEFQKAREVFERMCEILRPTHLILISKKVQKWFNWSGCKSHVAHLDTYHPSVAKWGIRKRFYLPHEKEYHKTIKEWDLQLT